MDLNVEANLHDAFKARQPEKARRWRMFLIEFVKQYVEKHPAHPPKK